MTVFDNPIGVACNWPHLDWHLGQGPGMNGLPGDSSSPSRFVRAAAFVASLRPVATGEEMEEMALHILNNFDIPLGFIRDNDDHTLWSSIVNLAQLQYIVRTYDNPVTQLIELGHVDFSAPGPRETALPHNAFAPLAV